jgi:hypothetical protein
VEEEEEYESKNIESKASSAELAKFHRHHKLSLAADGN